jgi:hypothetical protein
LETCEVINGEDTARRRWSTIALSQVTLSPLTVSREELARTVEVSDEDAKRSSAISGLGRPAEDPDAGFRRRLI